MLWEVKVAGLSWARPRRGPGLELENLSSVGRGLFQKSRLLPRAQGLAWILCEGPESSWGCEGRGGGGTRSSHVRRRTEGFLARSLWSRPLPQTWSLSEWYINRKNARALEYHMCGFGFPWSQGTVFRRSSLCGHGPWAWWLSEQFPDSSPSHSLTLQSLLVCSAIVNW